MRFVLLLAIAGGAFTAACSRNAGVTRSSPADAPATVDTIAERQPSPAGVAAAHPLAVEAGLQILRAGGSAVDAAIAVQAMLGLVEPQSSGIGGGAFLMYYDASSASVSVFDGREIAPGAARPDMLLNDNGEPLSFAEAVISGRATGIPGVIPMLGMAHARFGKLPWHVLFTAAERVADSGFVVPPRLGRFVNGTAPQASQRDVRALFAGVNGAPVQTGDTLRNAAYAETMRALAAGGPRTLHESPFAEAIVSRTRAIPRGGTMTVADLAAYEPVEREALCRPFRVYVVCVPPPPSSGVALLQLLALLERTDLSERNANDPQAWFLFAEASRLMYADRDRYVADPAFVRVPVAGLLDSAYVASRAALIGQRAGAAPTAGQPPQALLPAPDNTNEARGTSHFVIIDREGNAVSMTTTVESLFGSGRAVNGFLLNNELTDFAFVPSDAGVPVANAVAGGKRPRSSMAPTVVLNADGSLRAVLGSPGGSAILGYNAKALLALLVWDMPIQDAFDLPNIIARGDAFNGEAARLPDAVRTGLEARGIVVRAGDGEDSGLHGVIVRDDGQLEGGADRRRDGVWRALEQQ